MISIIKYELMRGLTYRAIRHDYMRAYTTTIPVIGAILIYVVYLLLPIRPEFLGEEGIVKSAFDIIVTLPGFYFAGLAAVATLGNVSMDKVMPHPAPRAWIKSNGVWIDVELSRRQFLSYVFSYLVLISFVLCVIFALIMSFEDHISCVGTLDFSSPVSILSYIAIQCFGFSILMMFLSMVTTTLHGMYFLTERVHQP